MADDDLWPRFLLDQLHAAGGELLPVRGADPVIRWPAGGRSRWQRYLASEIAAALPTVLAYLRPHYCVICQAFDARCVEVPSDGQLCASCVVTRREPWQA